MNVWVRIHGIPTILVDNDAVAHQTGSSLGSLIGLVNQTVTRHIDENMISYLRVGCSIDIAKPLRRCVAIGSSGPTPQLCPIQYEQLPTMFHSCDIVDKGKQPKIHTNDEEEKTNVKGTIFLNHNNENSLDAEPFTNAPTDPTGHASTVAAQVDTIGALSPTPLRVIKQSIKNAIDPAPAKGVIPADKADSTLEKDMGIHGYVETN
ncbi:hypothetical protein V6N13_043159 [Hibiscus sabdariffa]